MFTGIIEEVGTVKQITHGQHSEVLNIQARTVLENTKIGDSIAVNGICLTVTRLFADSFSADVMHETLNRSSLAGLMVGSRVNLERAMAADGRFGGHIVAGHVDGTGCILRIEKDDNAVWFTIHAEPNLLRYVVDISPPSPIWIRASLNRWMRRAAPLSRKFVMASSPSSRRTSSPP